MTDFKINVQNMCYTQKYLLFSMHSVVIYKRESSNIFSTQVNGFVVKFYSIFLRKISIKYDRFQNKSSKHVLHSKMSSFSAASEVIYKRESRNIF